MGPVGSEDKIAKKATSVAANVAEDAVPQALDSSLPKPTATEEIRVGDKAVVATTTSISIPIPIVTSRPPSLSAIPTNINKTSTQRAQVDISQSSKSNKNSMNGIMEPRAETEPAQATLTEPATKEKETAAKKARVDSLHHASRTLPSATEYLTPRNDPGGYYSTAQKEMGLEALLNGGQNHSDSLQARNPKPSITHPAPGILSKTNFGPITPRRAPDDDKDTRAPSESLSQLRGTAAPARTSMQSTIGKSIGRGPSAYGNRGLGHKRNYAAFQDSSMADSSDDASSDYSEMLPPSTLNSDRFGRRGSENSQSSTKKPRGWKPTTVEEVVDEDDEQADEDPLFVQEMITQRRVRDSNNHARSGDVGRSERPATSRPRKAVKPMSGPRHVSLRTGKAPFSVGDFGRLSDGEEDDDEEMEYSEEPSRKISRQPSNHTSQRHSRQNSVSEDSYGTLSDYQAVRSKNHTPSTFRHRQSSPVGRKDMHQDEDRQENLEESIEKEVDEFAVGYLEEPSEADFEQEEPILRIAGRLSNQKFSQSQRHLRPSRFAGTTDLPWEVNQAPPLLPSAEIGDASLRKRGLKRGKKPMIAKRGYGANDPENIQIVNMYESENLSFEEIAKTLNEIRLNKGLLPSLTAGGCTSRYGRTAPVLFAAQGEVFVPLSQRKRELACQGRGLRGQGQSSQPRGQQSRPGIVWNDELDSILVEITLALREEVWTHAAEEFNRRTGHNINKAMAGKRFNML